MGKSNKKIKTEKVNALRKQYDSYIEDEKKRKERNEYILEKLDKIRLCNTIVPLRHDTINRLQSLRIAQPVFEYNTPYSPLNEQLHVTKPNNHVNDNVIKEISKNFILIPKNKSQLLYEFVESPHENDNKTDWKSKYDILNQLKQSDKEPVKTCDSPLFQVDIQDFKVVDAQSLVNDEKPAIRVSNAKTNNNLEKPEKDHNNEWLVNHSLQNSKPRLISTSDIIQHKNIYINDNNNLDNDYEKVYKPDLPEKIPKVAFENTEKMQQDSTFEGQMLCEGDSVKHFDDSDNISQYINHESLQQDVSYDTYQYEPQTEIINSNIEAVEFKEDEQPHVEYTNSTEISIENPNTPCQNYTSGVNYSQENFRLQSPEQNISSHGNDFDNVVNAKEIVSPVELISPEATADIELNNSATLDFKSREVKDDSEHPIETNNDKNFTPNDGDEQLDGINNNPINNVTQHDVDNIGNQYNPQNQTTAENHESEQIINSSEIQAFEAEQNEMFYSEQPNETYDGYSENAGIGYTAQNENYENYQYYEGAQQDQVYQHDVNEYEETTQMYDPNYEQQYVDPYEQNDNYVEPAQQYEREVNEQSNDQAGVEAFSDTEIVEKNIETEPVIEKKLDDELGIAPIEQNVSEQSISSVPAQN